MSRPISLFVAALAVAIVITAATLPDRQTTGVINSLAVGATRLTEASLGQMPYKAR
jgi:hypothetical protein